MSKFGYGFGCFRMTSPLTRRFGFSSSAFRLHLFCIAMSHIPKQYLPSIEKPNHISPLWIAWSLYLDLKIRHRLWSVALRQTQGLTMLQLLSIPSLRFGELLACPAAWLFVIGNTKNFAFIPMCLYPTPLRAVILVCCFAWPGRLRVAQVYNVGEYAADYRIICCALQHAMNVWSWIEMSIQKHRPSKPLPYSYRGTFETTVRILAFVTMYRNRRGFYGWWKVEAPTPKITYTTLTSQLFDLITPPGIASVPVPTEDSTTMPTSLNFEFIALQSRSMLPTNYS